MRSSRTRRHRRQAPAQSSAMPAFAGDDTYRSVDIITADQLKDGAVAELTPPSGNQSIVTQPVPDEDSELGLAALPAAAIEEPQIPQPNMSYLRQATPRSLDVLDKDAYVRQDTPMQIPVAAVVKVGDRSTAVLSDEAALSKPVTPVFVEDAADDDEADFDAETDLLPLDDGYQESRDPSVAETVTLQYQAAPVRRGVLLPLLMFVFGLCVGLCAMQWNALLQFYGQWF